MSTSLTVKILCAIDADKPTTIKQFMDNNLKQNTPPDVKRENLPPAEKQAC